MTLGEIRGALERTVGALAMIGGVALTGVAVFTVCAVIGDAFGAPVLGDSEIVELVVAASVASFLPLCQLANGHVAITLFTDPLSAPLRAALEVLAAALMLVVAVLLTWRLGVGGMDAFSRERATMFLQLPLWWGYLGAFVGCLFWVVCAGFVLVERALGQVPETKS